LPHLLSAEPGIPFLKDAEREGEKAISPNQFTLLLRGWRDALFARGPLQHFNLIVHFVHTIEHPRAIF
jgi:hypothetical protein